MSKIILSESDIMKMVKEAASRVLNEIGDTPKGQYMLGRLDGRYSKRLRHGSHDYEEELRNLEKANSISKYASEKQLDPSRFDSDATEEEILSLPTAYRLGYYDEAYGLPYKYSDEEEDNKFRKKYLGGISKF